MAKNKPVQKNIPLSKPVQPTVKQPVGSGTAAKKAPVKTASSGSWFKSPAQEGSEIIFDKLNYYIIAAGSILVILGFILMVGGNKDPKVFNEAEIYSFQRITLSPMLIIFGFLLITGGILKRPAIAAEEK